MVKKRKEHLIWAEILRVYHRLGMPVRRAEAILVFCSHDLHVAEYAAQLWHKEKGRWLLFSLFIFISTLWFCLNHLV